tara:strand:+ start:74 stop:283 length:210 start_codon:yes stop_codon:yes gene_type:complete
MASGIEKINIYGDSRNCSSVTPTFKCNNKADLVESGKDYCVDCWTKKTTGLGIEQIKLQIKLLGELKHD